MMISLKIYCGKIASTILNGKLEQLDHLHSEIPPPSPRPYDYPNSKNLPKIQILEFCNNLYMRHTFWRCLIRCANMKWIRLLSWKIQNGHGFVHRRTDVYGEIDCIINWQTDGQMDGRRVKPVYPLSTSLKGGITSAKTTTLTVTRLCLMPVKIIVWALVFTVLYGRPW